MKAFLKNILEIASRPFRCEKAFFLYMFFVGVVCNTFVERRGSRLLGYAELYLDLYIICTFLILIPAKLRGIFRRALYVLFYGLAIIDLYLYYSTGLSISPQLLSLVLLTNSREACEAISQYASLSPLLSPLILILLVIALHVYTTVKKENCIEKQMKHFCHFSQSVYSAFRILLIVILLICIKLTWVDKEYKFHRLVLMQTELETQRQKDFTPSIYYSQPFYRLWYAVVENCHAYKVNKELSHTLRSGTIRKCSYVSPKIVLIIGESQSRHHTQLYNYDKPTTPYLKRRLERGELALFANVISPWNTTCESLQNIFSLKCYTGGNDKPWYEVPFFTSLMKKAHYHVGFYSNQYLLNNSNSFSDYIEDIFINLPSVSKEQFTSRNKQLYAYDGDMLRQVHLSESTQPELLIIHLMGMHFEFEKRFPPSFTRFQPNNYHRSDLSTEQKKNLSDYDNAIAYNDSIINAFLGKMERTESIVIYFPDHGERVYDYDSNFGRSLGNTVNEIRPQFEIPMWMWASKSYRTKHADIWERVLKARRLPYMTDAIGHTILHLAGIESPKYQCCFDILSPHYNYLRKRIIRGEYDYDKIILNGLH